MVCQLWETRLVFLYHKRLLKRHTFDASLYYGNRRVIEACADFHSLWNANKTQSNKQTSSICIKRYIRPPEVTAFDPWNRSPTWPFKTSNTLHVSWKTTHDDWAHTEANKQSHEWINRSNTVVLERIQHWVNIRSKRTLFTFLMGFVFLV